MEVAYQNIHRDIIELSKAGNQKAQFQLYKLYSKAMYNVCYRMMNNQAEAEDLLQDTASIMWTKFSEFTPGTDFTRWSCRIARFVIANHYRKKKNRHRQLHLNTELWESIAQAAESSDLLYRDDRIEALQQCLTRLRERDQKLIRWRYEAGSSIRNIAEAIGRSIDAVYKSLSRIHYQLLCCIEQKLRMEEG